jgi:hypothetical protein
MSNTSRASFISCHLPAKGSLFKSINRLNLFQGSGGGQIDKSGNAGDLERTDNMHESEDILFDKDVNAAKAGEATLRKDGITSNSEL